MPLFRIEKQNVSRIPPQEERIKEDRVHSLIEQKVNTFFGELVFVARKPRIGGKEFDTRALTTATNFPVIVEYKRHQDRSVFEQVDLYYVKLKNNKSDVLLRLSGAAVIEDLGD